MQSSDKEIKDNNKIERKSAWHLVNGFHPEPTKFAWMQTYFSENFLGYSFLITCFALGFQVIEQLPHSVHRQFDSNMIQGIFQITGGNGITIFSDLQNIKEN